MADWQVIEQIYVNKKNDTLIIGRLFLYGKKYQQNPSDRAPEYYAIVGDHFFYTVWRPVFKIRRGKLNFLALGTSLTVPYAIL